MTGEEAYWAGLGPNWDEDDSKPEEEDDYSPPEPEEELPPIDIYDPPPNDNSYDLW